MIIASLRKESGLTQSKLAGKMGVTDKAVSKWERDVCCPDVSTIPKLAELFEVSVDDLMQISKKEATKSFFIKLQSWFRLISKCLALAMAVAVFTLVCLNQLEASTGLSLLSLGLIFLSLNQFDKNDTV